VHFNILSARDILVRAALRSVLTLGQDARMQTPLRASERRGGGGIAPGLGGPGSVLPQAGFGSAVVRVCVCVCARVLVYMCAEIDSKPPLVEMASVTELKSHIMR
jgi:hypothetical protein